MTIIRCCTQMSPPARVGRGIDERANSALCKHFQIIPSGHHRQTLDRTRSLWLASHVAIMMPPSRCWVVLHVSGANRSHLYWQADLTRARSARRLGRKSSCPELMKRRRMRFPMRLTSDGPSKECAFASMLLFELNLTAKAAAGIESCCLNTASVFAFALILGPSPTTAFIISNASPSCDCRQVVSNDECHQMYIESAQASDRAGRASVILRWCSGPGGDVRKRAAEAVQLAFQGTRASISLFGQPLGCSRVSASR